MSVIRGFLFFLLLGCRADVQNTPGLNEGAVLDSTAAVTVAEHTWVSIYGEKVIQNKPYTVELFGDSVWLVMGTLHAELGGVPMMRIRKRDGAVLEVTHSK